MVGAARLGHRSAQAGRARRPNHATRAVSRLSRARIAAPQPEAPPPIRRTMLTDPLSIALWLTALAAPHSSLLRTPAAIGQWIADHLGTWPPVARA
jgi:hypothetical protein